MKRYNKVHKQRILYCLLFGAAVTVLNGCNNGSNAVGGNGTGAANTAYFKGIKPLTSGDDSIPMNIAWTMDGAPISTGDTLHDTAWHLLTLTVESMQSPLESPVAINGLQYAVWPPPDDNRGESVEVTDINCQTAQFSKNGDTCSAYIRATYNFATGMDNSPKIPVQVITGAYNTHPDLSAMLNVTYKPLLSYPQGDYRVIAPIETKYYTGSAVVANPGVFQILDMQNISMPPLTIGTISNLTNPSFTLMQRESNSANDPYYGPYDQCALTDDMAVDQVSYLGDIGSECILVYQAAESSNQLTQTDHVTLATDAGTTAPWTNNTLDLLANYAPGTPIPDNTKLGATFSVASGSATPTGNDMVMQTNGVLASGTVDPSNMPFNLVRLSYNFIPKQIHNAPYQTPYYQNGTINISDPNCGSFSFCPSNYSDNEGIDFPPGPPLNPYHPSIQAGQQIITDASSTNPVTIGKVTPMATINGTASGNLTVTACGGAYVTSNATITPMVDYSLNYPGIHLHMDNTSDGHCGGTAPASYDVDLPVMMGIKNPVVYHVDDSGCAGGNWDMGGTVEISGNSCSGNNCALTLAVTAHHGGVGGQCQDTQMKTYALNYQAPQIYLQLSQLSNFTPSTAVSNPQITGIYNQNLSAMLGTQSGPVAQSVSCDNITGTCNVDGLYSNGLSSLTMSYNIGLSAGDRLRSGTVNFTRSSGYDLSNFIISH